MDRKLSALTILVVNGATGLPGGGFHSLPIETAEDLANEQRRVFGFDWSKYKPDVADFS